MDYKELDAVLTQEFCDKVNMLNAGQLKSAASIRMLADISSVLLCLWHPAIQMKLEQSSIMAGQRTATTADSTILKLKNAEELNQATLSYLHEGRGNE